MSLTLSLDLSDVEREQLVTQARDCGITPEALAQNLLATQLKATRRSCGSRSLEQMIQEWLEEGDEEEQHETYQTLVEGLNSVRAASGQRKPFSE